MAAASCRRQRPTRHKLCQTHEPLLRGSFFGLRSLLHPVPCGMIMVQGQTSLQSVGEGRLYPFDPTTRVKFWSRVPRGTSHVSRTSSVRRRGGEPRSERLPRLRQFVQLHISRSLLPNAVRHLRHGLRGTSARCASPSAAASHAGDPRSGSGRSPTAARACAAVSDGTL